MLIRKSRWLMDKEEFQPFVKRIAEPTLLIGEPTVYVTLHQNKPSEKYHYLSEDYYDHWVDQFLQLIKELMKRDNGFYVTD
ncbi:MAG: hypothetical protein ACFE9L_17815 [Candidatus Hodarchaeota archaeon]